MNVYGTVYTMQASPEDIAALKRDKVHASEDALRADIARLADGEPLAYVIGWIPFHGVRVDLSTRPLIPRVETEYWTELLITHLKERFGESPFSFLDLCAGSGAIGLAVLSECPNAKVWLSELSPRHVPGIEKTIRENGLDASRVSIVTGDLFSPIPDTRFDVIATNPPYVPSERALPESVSAYEPHEALFAGTDGLALIRRIYEDVPAHLLPGGEVWLECDTTHVREVAELAQTSGARKVAINEDQYGRPRTVVSYYS